MDEVTLLNYEQVEYDREDELSIFINIEKEAVITDFAILLGGFYEFDRTGYYWIKSNNIYNVIDESGYLDYVYTNYRSVGIRPVLFYTNIKDNISNEIINEDGIKEVGYGEYPQKAVNKKLQEKLEELYKNNELYETNKTYTTDSRKSYEYDKKLLPQEHIEYEFDDKKYVRIKANSWYDGRLFPLSNGEKYRDEDYVWVEVSKVKWLVDEENNIVLSKDILVAGIQYDNKMNYDDDFENSNMYKYLNTYFIKDIQIKDSEMDLSKVTGTYEEAMALIEEAKRKTRAILDKSIIGKSLTKHL